MTPSAAEFSARQGRTCGGYLESGANQHTAASRQPLIDRSMSEVTEAAGPLIEFENVHKEFGLGRVAVHAVSFSVERGQFVVLTGPNGAGKTTLIDLITGFIAPDLGHIRVAGAEPARLRNAALAALRRAIGVLPQDLQLLPDRSVLDNVMLPALVAAVPRRLAEDRAQAALRRVGLPDSGAASPAMLSGGQRQRAALARAIVNKPTLLLLDEPLSLQDATTADAVMLLLEEFTRGGVTVLLAARRPPDRLPPAARSLRMAEGRLAA
jgi:cell division transport system ATP-binding protein